MTRIFLMKAWESPLQDECLDEIMPRLYLGTLRQACSPQILIDHTISHVLCVCQAQVPFDLGLQPVVESMKALKKGPSEQQISAWLADFITPEYCQIALPDKPGTDLKSCFPKAIQFLERALSNSTARVLVHCQAGVSRSTTVLIAYLMKAHQMGVATAYKHILARRPIIRPNPGFSRQLVQYHQSLYSDAADAMEAEVAEFISALSLQAESSVPPSQGG
ncbi:hypothetical protein HDV03_001400 [Kappamyces sp. JEL0829]|nr:hypothetical protein HDV03_001400 [Kappamyces sp. JEL0829]